MLSNPDTERAPPIVKTRGRRAAGPTRPAACLKIGASTLGSFEGRRERRRWESNPRKPGCSRSPCRPAPASLFGEYPAGIEPALPPWRDGRPPLPHGYVLMLRTPNCQRWMTANKKGPTSRDAGPWRTGKRTVGRSHVRSALPERPTLSYPVCSLPRQPNMAPRPFRLELDVDDSGTETPGPVPMFAPFSEFSEGRFRSGRAVLGMSSMELARYSGPSD